MRCRDYLLSVEPKRRRQNVHNLPVIRRGEIERHARYVGAADTEDFWRWLVAWCWHNGQNGRDPTGALKLAAKRMGGDLTEADAETILERAHAMRQHRTADRLARFLGVTDRQRTAAGITTIGGIDVDRKQRNRRRRERQRMNRERRRRARGARPRAEYLEANSLTRTKPWEAKGISRRTWYRRRGKSPPTAIPPLKGGDTNGTSRPTAIFLMAEDTPVPPERKQRGLRGGACAEGTVSAAADSARREETVSGPSPTSRPAWDAAAARSAAEDPTPAPPWVPYAQSSTARALAQAGDAGSSPAPVAKPDVDAQLGTAALRDVGRIPPVEPATMPAPERPSAPDTPVPVPERTNGGAPPSLPPTVGKPVLSSRDIQQEKEWVLDQERWVYSRADIAAGKLDEVLRAKLRELVLPEHVEIEFKRVMDAVIAAR